jgi:hypothetical protein
MTDLVRELANLRAAIAWPDDDADLATAAVAHLAPRRRRRRWPVVVVAAAVAGAVAVPVAADLAVRGVRTTVGRLPAGIDDDADLGRPASVRADAPRPPTLGRPVAAFAGAPEGGYTEVWDGPILLTSFPGSLDRDLIEKRLVEGGEVEQVTVNGAPAFWIRGPHGFLYLGPDGEPREDTLRLSRSALLWTRGGTTYRLESDLSRDRAISLAESMS